MSAPETFGSLCLAAHQGGVGRRHRAAAVVAVFTILTSLVLANNDAQQLDLRLDSIVDASMYPDQMSDPGAKS